MALVFGADICCLYFLCKRPLRDSLLLPSSFWEARSKEEEDRALDMI